MHTGKNIDSSVSDVGLCTRVMLELMSGLEKYHNECFTDNYYTSPAFVRATRQAFAKERVTKATVAIMTLGLMVHCLQLCG